ncbi:hypothetical protein ACKTEK_07840 [Tepidamorphus sp. 3E244]|uniref:hypothetical protein n=1 Tax=Tepidamorphus sp. 3E244 TaxID=3385498 RepID=UPI0038FC80FE
MSVDTLEDRLPPRLVYTKPRKGATWRKRAVMTWAALAGLAAAFAVSSALKAELGDQSLLAWLDRSRTHVAIRMAPDQDEAPMVTGSIGKDAVPMTDAAALGEQIARLETEVRRSEIEKKALLKRVAQLSRSGDASGDMITGSLPSRSDATAPVEMQDTVMRDAMTNAMNADLRHAQVKVTTTSFAVEIASARNIKDLRTLWDAMNMRHARLLDPYEARVNVRETDRGLTVHLIAGPMANAADAVNLCARLRTNGTMCSAVPFDGQALN